MDGTKPPFRPLAFILIDEVPVLKGNLFAAVFDFKDLTGVFFLVIDDHVKLASLKLQFENTVILVGRLHGFQQHNKLMLDHLCLDNKKSPRHPVTWTG